MVYKYVIYLDLNKTTKKVFDSAKEACKYAKEALADYGFTVSKDSSESWEDAFNADLVSIGKGEKIAKIWKNQVIQFDNIKSGFYYPGLLQKGFFMSVYTFTFITVVSMYLAYLWGRYLTRGEIAAKVATDTLNRLEREGFIKYIINKKTGQTDFVRFE